MITVLVVGNAGGQLEGLAGQNPSVEVLTAHGLEDALEKLGRNRRIDAVLLIGRDDPAGIVEGIREDNPAHPPLYLPRNRRPVPGTRILASEEPERWIGLLRADLES